MFASTERNLCVSVCQVYVLQSLRGDGGLCVTRALKRTSRTDPSKSDNDKKEEESLAESNPRVHTPAISHSHPSSTKATLL